MQVLIKFVSIFFDVLLMIKTYLYKIYLILDFIDCIFDFITTVCLIEGNMLTFVNC